MTHLVSTIDNRPQAFEKRWAPVTKARAELDTNILESEVYWGNEIKEKIATLSRLYAELWMSIEEHFERTNPRNPDEAYHGDELKANRAIIYGRSDRSKDPFQDRMLTAIGEVENILKPYIKKGKTSKNKAA